MLKLARGFVIFIGIFILAALLFAQLGFLKAKPLHKLGVENNKLAPAIYGRENSVNSQTPNDPDKTYHVIAPLTYSGEAALALEKIKTAAKQMACNLIQEKQNYLYFECESKILKYVDDLEFQVMPEQNLIHVRSSSRLGRKDFSVNRKRVEAFRKVLN